MHEWVVALILIGISIIVAAVLLGLCRLLGGWTWIYAWITGNKEERAQLATHEQFGGSNYMVYQPPPNNQGGTDTRPPFIQPQQVLTNNMKTDGMGAPAVSPQQVPPLPPPPNEPHPRRLSLRRSSLESELADILGLEGGGAGGGAGTKIQRAMSCDSVCSDTSVVLETLDSPQHSGELELSIEYCSKTEELIVVIIRVKGLLSFDSTGAQFDSYVRICLSPDQSTNLQTGVQRGTNEPEFNERFLFGVKADDVDKRTVQCLVYTCDKYSNTLIGECELRLCDINLTQPYRISLPIVDSKQKSIGCGELLFSLSYLPTAERLTVVVVKARNLVWTGGKTTADPFVKVYLLQKGKKISKKKTSVKRAETNPTFNEAMIFSVPAAALQNIQLRLTVSEYQQDGKTPSVGHVFVGPQCVGKSLSHWNQMMSSPRKPTAMWHPLRKREG